MSATHLGYFAAFGGSDTVLLDADAGSLRELGQLFRSIAVGPIKRLVVHRLPFVQVHHGVQIRVVCGSGGRGVQRDGDGNSFVWEESSAAWSVAAERIADLALSPRGGHCDLANEQSSIVVVVSKDEYGEEWWARNG